MTDLLDLTQGDTRTIEIETIDDATELPIDLTGAVLKFTAKRDPTTPNIKAELFKTSYRADEVLIVDAAAGTYIVQIQHADTKSTEPGRLVWDTQITRPDASITAAGTLEVVGGSALGGLVVLTGTGVDFSGVEVGDILVPAGALSGNAVRCTVEAVDAGADTIATDHVDWTTEAGFAFEIFRGDVKTPIDGAGCIEITQGVTT